MIFKKVEKIGWVEWRHRWRQMLSYQVLMEHHFHLCNLIIMEWDVNFDIIETGSHKNCFTFSVTTATWILPGTHARKGECLSAPLARREVTEQTLSVCLTVPCTPWGFIHAESKHRLLNCLCKYYLRVSWEEERGHSSGFSSLQNREDRMWNAGRTSLWSCWGIKLCGFKQRPNHSA